MEFKWQGKNYKLYGLGSLDHKVRITPSMEKEEYRENLYIQQGNTSKMHKDSAFRNLVCNVYGFIIFASAVMFS
jgi:hypothetical protein